MKPAFSKRDANRREFSGNTVGRLGASKIVRLACFLLTPARVDTRCRTLELYLPKSWTDNQERGPEAHVPEGVTFATKPELAWRMLERTLDAGFSVAWVTGDTVYGSTQSLRTALEARRQAYALAVTRHRSRSRCKAGAREWISSPRPL